MKLSQKKYLIFAFIAFIGRVFPVFPQDVVFSYYTIDQGLSQNMVDCILKDSRGFMWFGTWNGLNRFDGYDFVVYRNDNQDTSSIGDNFNYALIEDHFGNIWVGCDNGLSVFIFSENRFVNYNTQNTSISLLHNINSLTLDKSGNIWIGTDNGIGIIKPVDNKGNFERITDSFFISNLDGVAIRTLIEDEAGNIWIGTANGLFFYNIKERLCTLVRAGIGYPADMLSNSINTLYLGKEGVLWVGFEFMGALKYTIATKTVNIYSNNPDVQQSLVHNTVTAIQEDLNGNILIGTLGGLCVYDPAEENFMPFNDEVGNKSALNNVFVNCLYADEDGNVWVGTERGGVNKYNIYQKKFASMINDPKNQNSLSNNTVNSIFEDKKHIWIGTAGGGLNRYSKTSGSFKFYKNDPHNPSSLNNDFITTISRDRSGALWVGAWGGGLHKLAQDYEEQGIFSRFEDFCPSYLVSAFVSSLLEDNTGRLWIGTIRGLDVYNPQLNQLVHLVDSSLSKPLTEVGCLKFDKHGNLWIGTIHGLYYIGASPDGTIDVDNPDIHYYISNPADKHGLSGNYIISFCLDTRDTLWIGTYGNGLNKVISYDERNIKCQRFTEAQGLSNNTIYGIQEDDHGNLWMGTDNGLSKFNIETSAFKNYYKSDGLLSNQYYWSASYKNKDGKMYFGSMKGLNMFHPDSIKDNTIPPRIILTNLKVYNQPVVVGKEYFGKKILNQSISVASDITLSYRSKEFTIEFSALHYDQPDKNRYKFMLKGYDPDWKEVDSKHRYASYSNLQGGDYLFMIKASNNDGLWSKRPLTLKIHIIPPFWKTWWFRAALMGLIIAFTLVYIRVRLNTLKLQKVKLEKKVEERTAMIEEQKEELESQNAEILAQKDRLVEMNKKVQHANQQRMHFFTNISHEFRTPLTLILSPSEQMIEDPGVPATIKQKVNLIYTNARRLMKLINQLMDLRKIETGKIDIVASKDDIVLFVQNIANSFKELAVRRDLDFKYIPSKERIDTHFDHEKVENIVYNLLSNAFKYNKKNGWVTLEIDVYNEVVKQPEEIEIVEGGIYRKDIVDSYIEIKITDNGIGIDPENTGNIFKMFYRVPSYKGLGVQGTGIGLSLVKELVKAHRGWLFVKSEINKGSCFRVILPQGENYLLPDEKVSPDLEISVSDSKHEISMYPSDGSEAKVEIDEGTEVDSTFLPLILVVEDNVELRNYLVDQLQKFFRIIEASNGREGIEMAVIHSPDLIVSDIMMPELNGLELCARIKSELPTSHIPVILLTSRSGAEDHIQGYETGADDYIPKPFNLSILESRIKNLIRTREKLKALFIGSIIPDAKEFTHTSADETFLKKAMKVVSDNIQSSDFTVENFASLMHISRSLLHKKLTAIVGVSANDFITSIRLKKAASLLTKTDTNISEAAYNVGFNDPKYFSRCFKKHFGKSPSEFVKEKNAG
ncbi:MAG: response regulator [Bacteroidales bacterium]|nr:response regulator [Bacteroidales bacterium]